MSWPPEVQANRDRAYASLKAAKTLASAELFNDAASRAYYAAFHAASALLLTKGLKYGSHAGVLRAIGYNYVKTGLMAPEHGKNLNRLAKLRSIGDYGEVFYVNLDEVTRAITISEAFVSQADQLIEKSRTECVD